MIRKSNQVNAENGARDKGCWVNIYNIIFTRCRLRTENGAREVMPIYLTAYKTHGRMVKSSQGIMAGRKWHEGGWVGIFNTREARSVYST